MIKYIKASIDNEEQVIEQIVKDLCNYWGDAPDYGPKTLRDAVWDVVNDIRQDNSLPIETRRYYLAFENDYIGNNIKDNPDYENTYNKILDILYKYDVEKYIGKTREHGDKYFVTYYEEYPIYEPAEGGYYYAGNEVSYQVECDTLEEAKEEFDKIVKENGLDDDGNYRAYKYSKYIGEGASAYIESDSDINFPSVNSEVAGWHPYS